MASEYMTVLDTGTRQLPAVPLIVMLAVPVLMLASPMSPRPAIGASSTGPLKLFLWTVYASRTVPTVMFQYWTLWTPSRPRPTPPHIGGGRAARRVDRALTRLTGSLSTPISVSP